MAKPTKQTIRDIAAQHGIGQDIADQVAEVVKPHLDQTIGGNAEAALKSMVDRINAAQDEIDEHATTIADIYDNAKNDGWDVAVLKKIVKESRADPEKIVKQLTAEKVLETYRKAVGITTDLAEAHRQAAAAADVAEPKKRKRGADAGGHPKRQAGRGDY